MSDEVKIAISQSANVILVDENGKIFWSPQVEELRQAAEDVVFRCQTQRACPLQPEIKRLSAAINEAGGFSPSFTEAPSQPGLWTIDPHSGEPCAIPSPEDIPRWIDLKYAIASTLSNDIPIGTRRDLVQDVVDELYKRGYRIR